MTKLSDEEMQTAFILWHRNYKYQNVDQAVLPFLNAELKAFIPGQPGWLRQARKANFLSADQMAKNLRISRGTYSKYEEQEEKGTITLEVLARAAQAMDCELVYGIRPRDRKRFSLRIWKALVGVSLEHGWLRKCDQRKRANALAYVATSLMADPEFKRKQSWSLRANEV